MLQKKLSLFIATTPYGGNGQASSEHPDVRNWLIQTVRKVASEPRISEWTLETYNDTPCPMVRNLAVIDARKAGADLLLFIDSDQSPDNMLVNDSTAIPFWDAAFDFIYRKWEEGPYVVGAPYMGGDAGHENVFVMKWRNFVSSYRNDIDMKLDQYNRNEANAMSGIHECAALPTGLILYAMPVFDLIEPAPDDMAERIAMPLVKRIEAGNNTFTPEQMKELVEFIVHEKTRLEQPYFYYEYTDQYQQKKASTEDITNTRYISIAGILKLGYNPIQCAWSSWAGHWKPRNVSKPVCITASDVAQKFKNALKSGGNSEYKRVDVGELIDASARQLQSRVSNPS